MVDITVLAKSQWIPSAFQCWEYKGVMREFVSSPVYYAMLAGVKSLMEALMKFQEDEYGKVGAINDSKQTRPDNDGGSSVFRQNGYCSDLNK